MEERNKNSALMAAVITLMAVAILGLVGFIVYDKIFKDANEPNVEENNNEEDNIEVNDGTETAKEEYKNLSTEDKVNYNKRIEEKLSYYFTVALNDGLIEEDNANLLNNIKSKINFTWQLSFRDEEIKVNSETSETGYVGISLSDIIAKHKALFNETVTETEILNNSNFTIQNGYVYGNVITGATPDFALKIKSHAVNTETNKHLLIIDFITKLDENNKFDFESYMNYLEATVVDYPQDVVYAQVKIELEQVGENYIFKSIVFEK